MAANETLEGIIKALFATWRQPFSVDTAKMYALGLADIPVASLAKGFGVVARSNKFMPSVAEIREACGYHVPSVEDRAEIAWIAVERAVVRLGAYKTVNFDDGGVANAVIRSLGGWPALCGTPTEEFDTFTRQKFLKAYKSLISASIGEEYGAPLEGINQRTNGTAPVAEVKTGLPAPVRRMVLDGKPSGLANVKRIS